MNHAMLLDCTLRDGAYLIDKKFGDSNIKGIIDGLMKANLDCIEIGFFQNDEFGEGKTVFRNSEDAKRFIPKDKKNTIFTVLADYSRYDINNLDKCRSDSVDGIRECFFKAERFNAVNYCRVIKEKGYKCFVQPVDILGYTDLELIELIQLINEVDPYCFSIVDTFGSMYQEDLHRVFEIINHNLISTCKIGFHSHNNMQLSSALSQEFVRMSYGKRKVIVDATISGMGRGAGNTPTELIAQYMITKLGYSYDLDAILDVIDDYMDNIRYRCSWGYSTPYFVAGCYSAHVNNIAYLTKKNSIRSKDIRYILNKIGPIYRKRYHYDLLEKTYLEYLESDIDDSKGINDLKGVLSNKDVLILVPGSSVSKEVECINRYIKTYKPIVISVNFLHDSVASDLIFMSNSRRYSFWEKNERFNQQKKIFTSNLKVESKSEKDIVISFRKLVKCGWDRMDNSTILLLRLLDEFDLKSIAIAGFDGYSYEKENATNYAVKELELSNVRDVPGEINDEITSMLKDYKETRKHNYNISFLTASRFDYIFTKVKND